MKIKVAFLMLFAFFAINYSAIAQQGLPNINVKTLSGQDVNIQDHATNDKITVLSFWATWCSPCKKELDAIADVYPDWQEMYDVEFVAVSIDDARGFPKIGPMISEKGWEFTFYSDINQELKQAMNFQTVPQTFVVDKNGNVVFSHSGYVPGDEIELEEFLEELSEGE